MLKYLKKKINKNEIKKLKKIYIYNLVNSAHSDIYGMLFSSFTKIFVRS